MTAQKKKSIDGQPTVLIVEDIQYVGELAALVLRRSNLNAVLCLSAEDAIDYIENHEPPDIIVTDIGMPGCSGWEFLDIVKAREEVKTIPVVVTTAYSDAANRLLGRLREVDRYLTKPYKPNELQSVVSEILEAQGLRAASGAEPPDIMPDLETSSDEDPGAGLGNEDREPDFEDKRPGTPLAIESMAQMLRHTDPVIQGKTVIGLAELRRKTSILRDTPAQDAFWRNVYHTLNSFATTEAAIERWAKMAELACALTKPETEQNDELLRLAAESQSVEIRRAALDALGTNRHLPALDILMNSTHDPDKSIRRTALEALGNLGDAQSIDVVRKALSDEIASARFAAVNALAKIGDNRAIDILKETLDNADCFTRLDIARALGSVDSPRSTETLVGLANTEQDHDVLYAIATALGQLGNPEARPVLERLQQHDNEHVREGAQKALDSFGEG